MKRKVLKLTVFAAVLAIMSGFPCAVLADDARSIGEPRAQFRQEKPVEQRLFRRAAPAHAEFTGRLRHGYPQHSGRCLQLCQGQSGEKEHQREDGAEEDPLRLVRSNRPCGVFWCVSALIVDDHPLFRKGLLFLLGTEEDMRVVGEAGDGWTAIDRVRELSPDVVIMDITMPNLDGIEATRLPWFPHLQVTGKAS